MTARLPDHRPAHVALLLRDGTRLAVGTESDRGDWADPYAPAEIRDKYLSLTARLWPGRAAAAVWDETISLETRDTICQLATLMRGAANGETE